MKDHERSEHWLQRRTRYGDVPDEMLEFALENLPGSGDLGLARLAEFVSDVREEYFSVLAHNGDSRYYRTHLPRPEDQAAGRRAPPGKYAPKRRDYVVSMGEDLGAIKISGWTHTIPEYFDFGRFWAACAACCHLAQVRPAPHGFLLERTRPA